MYEVYNCILKGHRRTNKVDLLHLAELEMEEDQGPKIKPKISKKKLNWIGECK